MFRNTSAAVGIRKPCRQRLPLGYALEHVYARDSHAMKVVYQLIQIAHLINQLVLKADILGVFGQIENLKSYAKWFTQALNRGIVWGDEFKILIGSQIQIRWKTQ